MMDAAAQKQLRHKALLQHLEAVHPSGLTLRGLHSTLNTCDFPCTEERLLRDLEHLIASGLVEQKSASLSPGHKFYHITDSGINAL